MPYLTTLVVRHVSQFNLFSVERPREGYRPSPGRFGDRHMPHKPCVPLYICSRSTYSRLSGHERGTGPLLIRRNELWCPTKSYTLGTPVLSCGTFATPPHPKGVGWRMFHIPLNLRPAEKKRPRAGLRGTGCHTHDSTRAGYPPLELRQSDSSLMYDICPTTPTFKLRGTIPKVICLRSTSSQLSSRSCEAICPSSTYSRNAMECDGRLFTFKVEWRIGHQFKARVEWSQEYDPFLKSG